LIQIKEKQLLLTIVKEKPDFCQNTKRNEPKEAKTPYLCNVKRTKRIKDNNKRLRKENKMMYTMLTLAVEAFAAYEAMYICKNAKVLMK